MRKLTVAISIVIILSSLAFAGKSDLDQDGILTPEIISEIQKSFTFDPRTKASYNALLSNELKDISKNHDVWNSMDYIFSLELDIEGMTDQASSGRCWLFATYNILRQKIIQEHNLDDFEFSVTYSMFWDKFEKANLFLEYIIMNPGIDFNDREFVLLLKTPLSDGGFWHMSADVITKYGAMPKNIMPESHSSSSTGRMNNLMQQKMRMYAYEMKKMADAGKSAKKMRKAKVEMLKEVYRMLVLNLGLPPETFEWRYVDKDGKISETKTYTPKSFYNEVVGVDLNEYIVIGNCPTQPFNKNYQIKLGRGVLEGTDWIFLNLDMNTMKELAVKVLQDSIPCQFSMDISSRQRDADTGYMAVDLYDYESVYGIEFKFDKVAWILTRESAPNHAMTLVGVDIIDGKTEKWKIENSWNDDRGEGGFFVMTDEWFDRWGYSIVLEKKYLPPEILELLDDEPVSLPFWDPLARTFSVGGYDN